MKRLKPVNPDQHTNKEQVTGTGMAMVLICLIAGRLSGMSGYDTAAIILLVLTMACPVVFKPVAYLWFGMSRFLGRVSSTVFLTLIFFLMVTPVGLIRQRFGYDPFKRGQFKKGAGSCFSTREHLYSKTDLETPY